ncbi:hypothetical protein FQN55_003475 [Onygenales sp. PD_40]|nr:hypothetical protein FQN55_003475 [Onygenales sp. PD_40]KAK2805361.1 hypothetical protein FQN51_000187 [Onygenales sp. PD_10]
MAFIKYLVPALAVAGLAVGQNSCGGTKTIKSQGDADGLSSCKTFKGDIVIDPKVPEGPITIDGIETITGSLTVKGAANLTRLVSSSIEKIEDTFTLSGAVKLSDLQFDSLTEVGALNFEALSVLQNLGFTKGVSKAGNIRITNTQLTSLTGIELETVGDMEITNNPHLTEVNVNQITEISGYASFSANDMKLKISFPNLEKALNMTFRNTSSVTIPSLKSTKGLLGFYSNYFEDFYAGNLTSTGDLVFADNGYLTNISLPVLETVKGAFQIANNTQLKKVNDVPKLKTIEGALDFAGNFSSVELPGLEEVRGKFNLQSTGKVGCDKLKGEIDVGTWVCREEVEDPQSGTGTKTGSGAQPSKTGAAVPMGPPAALTMLALIGGAMGFAL